MFYTQESAKYIPALEAKLSNNPRSPVFARLASYYLKEGKAQQAIDTCVAGLRFYPDYASARLILGRAYEAMGRDVEALLEYRKLSRLLPDNPTVADLLTKVERREKEAFRAFAAERLARLEEHKNTLTFETYIAGQQTGENTVDFLLHKLRDAKRVAPPPTADLPREDAQPQVAPKIVTATLAEIYASQGEYKAAIDAYRKLRDQNPGEADRYEKRITELDEMTRQHIEQKS